MREFLRENWKTFAMLFLVLLVVLGGIAVVQSLKARVTEKSKKFQREQGTVQIDQTTPRFR